MGYSGVDMVQYSADVSEQDFDELVIKASHERLVVVDFWAPWCGPCRVLKPILEKLAEEYAGRFFLAKVNADQSPTLCTTYGVRGIPSVKAFVDGAIVDDFAGGLPESYVRDFIARSIPSKAKQLIAEARTAKAQGDVAAAARHLDEALSLEPNNELARVQRAALWLDQGDAKEAAALVEGIRGDTLDYQEAQVVLARLRFAQENDQIPADAVLKKMLAAGGEEATRARILLAVRRVANGAYEDGLSELLAVLKTSPRDVEVRGHILGVFEILGPDDPVVQRYRRAMATLLH